MRNKQKYYFHTHFAGMIYKRNYLFLRYAKISYLTRLVNFLHDFFIKTPPDYILTR